MPLMHTRDSVERFLGSVSSIEKPSWLGAVPLTTRKLIDHEVIWPAGASLSRAERIDRQVPILHARREARIVRSERRQFRVYDGGLSHAADDR